MELGDLKVWRESRALVVRVYQLTGKFPKHETYGLVDQLRRATNSVCANIAEGYGRHHPKEKVKFYYNARGSLFETRSHISVAQELGYIDAKSAAELLLSLDPIGRMINGLINSLSRYHSSLARRLP